MRAVWALLAKCVGEGSKSLKSPPARVRVGSSSQPSGAGRPFATGRGQCAAVDLPAPISKIDKCAATFGDGVAEVRGKNEQLRAVLKTLPWPELVCLEVQGRVCHLPICGASRASMRTPVPCDSADASNLRYLAGFFDGDGCVSCSSDLSGCIVAVTQSFDKADVLMLLCEMFGGSIRRSRNGVGLWKPVLQWIACGQSARRAASLLAPHSITKRKQLLLAGAWPKQRSDREDCKVELRALKYSDSAVAGPCSWEYCAGFFDAEGCISQPGGGACLRLDIVQKHAQVLKCLSDFLAGSIGIHAKVSAATSTMHRLRVHGLRNCKQMLQCMLEAGLLCKAKQAELALGLTAENAMQVCAEFAHLTGNQQYGKRLDADRRQNIKMITTLRRQAGNMIRRKELHKAEVILRKLEVLQSEHELSKALNENVQLLEYSRGIEFLHDICWDGSRMHSFCSLAAVRKVNSNFVPSERSSSLTVIASYCNLDGNLNMGPHPGPCNWPLTPPGARIQS